MPRHIVLILSDQHNAVVMGWAGDPWVRTPHLDALAAAGTALTACSCASPLCVPSRAALLGSLLPSRTGIFTNDQCLRSDRVTFIHQLALAGMDCVLAGRMHFKGPDQRHGFQRRLVGDISDTRWGHDTEPGDLYTRYGSGHGVLDEAGPGESRVLAYDRAVADAACALLAAHDPGRPLFLAVGLYGPHNPWVCDAERFARYARLLPQLPRHAPERLPAAARLQLAKDRMLAPDAAAVHRARAAYYGMVEILDGHVGSIREAAARLGDDVLVVYASDHGEMLGSHGTFWKSQPYEGAVRVPVIAVGAGVGAGRRIATPTSLLDLGPTLIQAVGGEGLPESDGESLWDQLTGGAQPDADRAVVIQYANRSRDQVPWAAIRRGGHKLISYGDGSPPLLFDLAADPGEERDLAADPPWRSTRDALAGRLGRDWDPAAADRAAKLATEHMRRLVRFHDLAGGAMPERWIAAPGSERRAALDDRTAAAGSA